MVSGWVVHPSFDSAFLAVSHYGTVGAPSFAGVAKRGLAVLVVTRFDFYGCSIIEFGKSVSHPFRNPPFERREERGPKQLDFVARWEGWAPTSWYSNPVRTISEKSVTQRHKSGKTSRPPGGIIPHTAFLLLIGLFSFLIIARLCSRHQIVDF